MFEWYWVFLFYFVILHVRSIVITIYIHRGITHSTLEISNIAESIFKFLAWVTKLYFDDYKRFYRAQHRKHHDHSDTPLDPHSPHHLSIHQLLDVYHNEPGRPYYVSPEDLIKYSSDVMHVESWADKKIFQPYQNYGYWIWYPIIFYLFGPVATLISIVILKYVLTEFYLIIANYGYHKFGYQVKGGNRRANDKSRNFLPIGILFSGEELHSNHHNYPGSAKFSRRWFEFDMGWVYIKILEKFNLVKIKS